MTLTYQLDHHDFLQHQLFSASKTPRIKKKRTTTWLMLSGSILLLCVVLYQSNNDLFYYFLAFGIITFLFYPFYERYQYKNYYTKFIADTYKNRFGQPSNVTFTDRAIEINDITGEAKINLTEIENVTETGEYFYPKLKTGGHIIIPKTKVDNITELRNELKQLCNRLNIDFIDDLHWKWK
jgi:hypothetical protein